MWTDDKEDENISYLQYQDINEMLEAIQGMYQLTLYYCIV